MNRLNRLLARTPAHFTSLLAAILLVAGCGDSSDAPADSASVETAGYAAAADGPSATVQWGEVSLTFNGGRCFLSEDGGSDGAISLSKATSDDGAELTIDWAGDSPNSSLVSIRRPDGTQLEASTIGASSPPFKATVSGSTATINTTMRGLFDNNVEPQPATITLRCR